MNQVQATDYLNEALESLKTLDPLRIVLFGSAARGEVREWSDLDFLIVLDSDRIPETYEEKMQLKLDVRKKIRKLSYKVPIDLLVYTRPEYEALVNQNSSFVREILAEGKTLYESKS